MAQTLVFAFVPSVWSPPGRYPKLNYNTRNFFLSALFFLFLPFFLSFLSDIHVRTTTELRAPLTRSLRRACRMFQCLFGYQMHRLFRLSRPIGTETCIISVAGRGINADVSGLHLFFYKFVCKFVTWYPLPICAVPPVFLSVVWLSDLSNGLFFQNFLFS